jgi:hypothetical protein
VRSFFQEVDDGIMFCAVCGGRVADSVCLLNSAHEIRSEIEIEVKKVVRDPLIPIPVSPQYLTLSPILLPQDSAEPVGSAKEPENSEQIKVRIRMLRNLLTYIHPTTLLFPFLDAAADEEGPDGPFFQQGYAVAQDHHRYKHGLLVHVPTRHPRLDSIGQSTLPQYRQGERILK